MLNITTNHVITYTNNGPAYNPLEMKFFPSSLFNLSQVSDLTSVGPLTRL